MDECRGGSQGLPKGQPRGIQATMLQKDARRLPRIVRDPLGHYRHPWTHQEIGRGQVNSFRRTVKVFHSEPRRWLLSFLDLFGFDRVQGKDGLEMDRHDMNCSCGKVKDCKYCGIVDLFFLSQPPTTCLMFRQ